MSLGCGAGDELSRGSSPCATGHEACGRPCNGAASCPAGLHCGENGLCAQQCRPGDERECSEGACSADGRCPTEVAGEMLDGGGFGNPTNPAPPARDSSIPARDPETCASTSVHVSRVVPTVILIVDQSSSMTEEFEDGESRWNALRDFLLGEPDGLIAGLQDRVRFGLALYSAESGGANPEPIGECPMVTTVEPALDNFPAIAGVYRDADVIEDTPTGDSIDRVIDDLELAPDPDAERNPIVFIVATDGEPDRCEALDPQEGQQEAIDAVTRAFELGIHTFIISVGRGTVSAEHQQAVANAGLGRGPADPPAEYWVAGDDSSLRQALSDIVGAQLSCEVELEGEIQGGDACEGTVLLNGEALSCNDENGWELADQGTIRLLGSACERFKNEEVLLNVRFPCGVEIVF